MRIRCLIPILLIAAASVRAQTNVSGNVYGVWTPEGNPYNVVGAVTVPDNHYLTIMPGVEVRFTGYYGITVLGGMCAWGTEQDSVKFYVSTGQIPGYWRYIEYRDVISDSTTLRYCLIESGDRAVYASGSWVTLDHCLIQAHDMSPIKGLDADITLVGCAVTNNGESGLSLQNTAVDLQDCSISYNSGTNGRGINASGGGSIAVNGGYIGHNTGSGIYGLQVGSVNLQNVEIADNGDGGVELTLCSQLTASRVCIHDNDFHGIFLSSTALDGRNLTISSNLDDGIFSSGAALELSSSIVDHNGNWGAYLQTGAGNLSYNDFYSNAGGNYFGATPGSGSIEEDPHYTNYGARNYNLEAGSPCIDTGNPNDPLDPDGTRTDMGAFYFNQSPVAPESGPPAHFEIFTAYPNPFNPILNVRISAVRPEQARLQAWTADGRLAAIIWEGRLNSGLNEIQWHANSNSSGLYFLRLDAQGSRSALPCILIK